MRSSACSCAAASARLPKAARSASTAPLTGERVHLYEGRRGGIVCELCRTLRREPPVATELVRHCEHGHAVRLTVRVTRADAHEIETAA